MNILVLGGTRFVGRAIVESSVSRGHQVTIVHRGQTNPNAFLESVRTIHADRLTSLNSLPNERWDVCIDTCAYFPRAVRLAGEALSGSVRAYCLISTISVYDNPPPDSEEDAPLIAVGDPANEEVTAESYGYLKVLCEQEAVKSFGEASLMIRPGLVIGPHDPSDRFTYWPLRMHEEPAVLTPAGPDRPVQWIDARDLASFTIQTCERGLCGPIHVVGPKGPITLRMMLAQVRDTVNPACALVEKPIETIGVAPWTDLPMVTQPDDGLFLLSPRRALECGLVYRSLAESAADTLAWRWGQDRPLATGLSPEAHRKLLEA